MDDLPFIDGKEKVVLFSSKEAEQQYLKLQDDSLNGTIALFNSFAYTPGTKPSAVPPCAPLELVITLLRAGHTQFEDFSTTLKLRGLGAHESYFLAWYAYGYFSPDLEDVHKKRMSLAEFINKEKQPSDSSPVTDHLSDDEQLFKRLWDSTQHENTLVLPKTIPNRNDILIRQSSLKGSFLFTRDHIVLFTHIAIKKQFLAENRALQLQGKQSYLLTIELPNTASSLETTPSEAPSAEPSVTEQQAGPEADKRYSSQTDTAQKSQSKPFRPYFFKSLESLEQLFNTNSSSEDVLLNLQIELEARQTTGAKKLLQKVQAALKNVPGPNEATTSTHQERTAHSVNSLAHLYPIENPIECKRFYAQSLSAAIEKSDLPSRTKSAINYWKTQGKLKYKTIGDFYTSPDGGRDLCSVPGIGDKRFERIRDYLISLAPQSLSNQKEESGSTEEVAEKPSPVNMHSFLNRHWTTPTEDILPDEQHRDNSVLSPETAPACASTPEDNPGETSVPLPEYTTLANRIRKTLPVSDFQIIMGRGVQELQYDQLGQRLNMSRRDVRKREQMLLNKVSQSNQPMLESFITALNQHLDATDGDSTLEAAGEVTHLPAHQLKLLIYFANNLQEQPCWIEGNRLVRLDQ